MTKPLILVTNDDGITAPGIIALIEVAKKFGEVWVVAPDKPQSGMGHAVTLNATLRVNEVIFDNEIHSFSTTGTPVDCVKLAVKKILPRKPDLLLSGINHGSNSSISVIYSGTMSAAVEGALENIPSIGFSLGSYAIDADFSTAQIFAEQIIKKVIDNQFPAHTCLNVNIPNLTVNEIAGIKVCRQAQSIWEEDFDERIDPYGRKYYWMTGKMNVYDVGKDTDEQALSENFVSIVPVQFDLTAHQHITTVNNWFNEN